MPAVHQQRKLLLVDKRKVLRTPDFEAVKAALRTPVVLPDELLEFRKLAAAYARMTVSEVNIELRNGDTFFSNAGRIHGLGVLSRPLLRRVQYTQYLDGVTGDAVDHDVVRPHDDLARAFHPIFLS